MKLIKKKISKIYELLSLKEKQKFKDFLNSPYHVSPNEAIIFLKLLESLGLGQSTNDFDEAALFLLLYPGKPFVSGKIDRKIDQLTSLMFEFLGLEEVRNGNAIEIGTLQSLRAKGLKNLYLKEYKKIKKKFSKNRTEMVDGYLAKFTLDLEECRFLNLEPAKNNQPSYDLVYKSLDDLYINYFIYLGVRNLNYNNFIKPKGIQSKFESVLNMLEKRDPNQKSNSQIFEENIFKVLWDASLIKDDKVEELAIQLEKIKKEISLETYKNYRTLIRSFTITQYNLGDLSLGPVLFQLYKSEIENKSIFFESKISSTSVNNIAMSAIRENEVEWLANFLNEMEARILEPDLAKFTIALNRGKLFFAQKKFNKVLDVLIFDVKEFYLKVHARILELMTYYELNIEQLHHKIDAYKIFIYRLPKAKVGKDFITAHHNFIRILRSICHTNTIFDINRIQRLKSKIIETEILAEQQWLLQKVEELEEKNT